ncbi:hypothetical protein [uncultured Mediterranean phage uvMED]|nr:hypothetical protein [uncultured Mediterranean phage uvMED]
MWMNYHSIATRNLVFPYRAKSPTLKKSITYTKEEVWNEIDRVLEEDHTGKFTAGQQLYYNMLHCADSTFFYDNDVIALLEEYLLHKRFNMPLYESLDNALCERMSLFAAIDEEYLAIQRMEKDGS